MCTAIDLYRISKRSHYYFIQHPFSLNLTQIEQVVQTISFPATKHAHFYFFVISDASPPVYEPASAYTVQRILHPSRHKNAQNREYITGTPTHYI